MAKQKVSTKTKKRYRYSSFKARIDDLKIEPAHNLEKRVHDYVETSHFLASFEHWKDINLSAGFTEFAYEVQPMVQTLPQILHYQDIIFEKLLEYIKKQNEKCLQPLLDLLAQFCHDLGPDFLKFYKTAVLALIGLLDSAADLESLNVFEWGFNCLAYLFKYLSRILSNDLRPTFDILFPLLSHSKEYISRFSAEALSFLVRKTNSRNLSDFISHVLQRLQSEQESHFYDGLLTLFTEALTTTPGALHSKAQVIVRVLASDALRMSENEQCVNLFCDIWMNISKHSTVENMEPVTECLIDVLKSNLTNERNAVMQILSVIVYAESGRKISNWDSITWFIGDIIAEKSFISELNPSKVCFFFAIILRNADLKSLTKCYRDIFDFFMHQYQSNFLVFLSMALELSSDRLFSLNGGRFLQQFINDNWGLFSPQLALFIQDLEEKNLLHHKINVSVPHECVSSILSYFHSISEITTLEEFYNIYWRVILMRQATTIDFTALSNLSKLILSSSFLENDFSRDVLGLVIECLSSGNVGEYGEIIYECLARFSEFRKSIFFIKGLNKVLSKFEDKQELNTKIGRCSSLLSEVSSNFSLPNSSIRYETMNLLYTIFDINNQTIPQLLNECKIIEQIPLTLENARDITTRIRNLGAYFSQNSYDNIVITSFIKDIFGLLTVRFSPVWDGISEIIPLIYKRDTSLVWSLLLQFLTISDNNEEVDYYEHIDNTSSDIVLWSSHIPRLEGTIETFISIHSKYHSHVSSMVNYLKEKRGSFVYPQHVRAQSLKLLLSIPHLAEKNSQSFVPFLFNDIESDELFESNEFSAAVWSEQDRNMLLKIVAKFSDMKHIYKSEELYNRLLNILGSRHTEAQKLALSAISSYKIAVINKYKDNLRNLLDDTLFKDEITKFLSEGGHQAIDKADEDELIPYVLRILFGRVQAASTSGLKKSRKVAALSVLPSLKEEHISAFLALGYSRFEYEYFFENGYHVSDSAVLLASVRKLLGFVTIFDATVSILGSKVPHAILSALRPLVYSIAVSYAVSLDPETEAYTLKMAANLRQKALKCLNDVFQNLGDRVQWNEYVSEIYEVIIDPRIETFAHENLQQVSSILKLVVFWTKNKEFYPFLYRDDYSIMKALMCTLSSEHVKEPVVATILDGVHEFMKNPTSDGEYVEVVTLIVTACLELIPKLYKNVVNNQTNSIAVALLLNMAQLGYIQSNETRQHLLNSMLVIVEDNFKKVDRKDIANILDVISLVAREYECAWDDIEPLYKAISNLYKSFSEKELRGSLNSIFLSISEGFPKMKQVSLLLCDLNSYSPRRIQEYDFPKMLSAFKKFIDGSYNSFNVLEWYPIICTCLFFIKDKEELAIRTNAAHVIKKFIDYMNAKDSEDLRTQCAAIVKDTLLPAIRDALKRNTEESQAEYISVLAYIVENSKYFTSLNDMRILLFNGDEEANFFSNITHIQLHRRQRAIKRLGDVADELADNSIAHYLLPIAEHYVFSTEEKYRNLGNTALVTIGSLSNALNWHQYKALVRRYVFIVKKGEDNLKAAVLLLNQISVSFKNSMQDIREIRVVKGGIKKVPSNLSDPEKFVKNEIYPTLNNILAKREEETVISRIPLTEALVNFILGLSKEDTVSLLPGILTSVCQILRSRSEELRESVRTTLSKVTTTLGPNYIFFIIKELKSALKRGSQVHVLSYTVHHLLRALSEELQHTDLDQSARMIVQIIMEDIFGSAGQEKDSDNYRTKMKEVKINKSYDTGEILAANISLNMFNELLQPVRALLSERMGLKNQNKLEELLRRYTLGLNRNSASSSKEVLSLCYEIFQQSQFEKDSKASKVQPKSRSEAEEFFLVNLNAKSHIVQIESSLLVDTLQKFSLDLLRTVLTRHRGLLEVSHVGGFIPVLKESLLSANEGVLISTLRLLVIVVKLDFSDDSEPIFKNGARKVLNLIKDSPSTSSELCQIGLKFLSSFIRHKDIKLKDTALSYVLGRILPDLNEPSKQGLAFNFLKALVSKHIMLPEIYDVINVVRETMVTNHSKEIRDVARSVYFQFLMEYDQSRGRLEKQFKFMVDNLQYPSQEGKQSILELINLIIIKASPDLLSRLSSSFFLSLANLSLSDDSSKCREMATLLLSALFNKLSNGDLVVIKKYLTAWLKQEDKPAFLNLGLRIHKIYISSVDFQEDEEFNVLALNRIKGVLSETDAGSETQWDLIYTALNDFTVFYSKKEFMFEKGYKSIWQNVLGCLLYPHMWVRQIASQIVNDLFNNIDKFEEPFNNAEIQNISSRLIRQLSAPSISEGLATICVKTLVQIAKLWSENQTEYIVSESSTSNYLNAIDYMVTRTSALIRSQENPADSLMSKKSGIQLFIFLLQILSTEQIKQEAEKILLALYMYLETDSRQLNDDEEELNKVSQECLQMLESKLSVPEFTTAYANVKQVVIERRQERKAKRSILAVNAPDIAAQKKIKKHVRSREKRKHERDDSGFYQRRNKKKRV
ncbi:hypothetical protein KAFR_0F02520 [Kazachstania africana CBS 2517]|uniref:Uncharacterized protein n=1 Tax=Kazachstania africana (strain ATCC 22294 / BCRC 22015 / CBS 2517 / CECT 1963 / NBRC 1671 / NRRL Y-8276) TaxID=1071382 RepID=H2AWU9_KAZAF|nr:hypothetical protein KAFR_0F02520 [Kazachstania africana CBS 2517]CCF58849.1 hypothetical protein KAFR_0F02520 [Kazachstania africana CBS 2517]